MQPAELLAPTHADGDLAQDAAVVDGAADAAVAGPRAAVPSAPQQLSLDRAIGKALLNPSNVVLRDEIVFVLGVVNVA